jgi:hypothetical protein
MNLVGFGSVHPIFWRPKLRRQTTDPRAGCGKKTYPFKTPTASIGFSYIAMLLVTTCVHAVDQQPGAPESLESSASTFKAIDLFNGKDLAGWQQVGNASWQVQEGLLIGHQGPEGAAGDLLSRATYDNFHLVVVYKVHWPANTGIWYRYQSPSQAYQADILEHEKPLAYSGSLYCPGKLFIATNKDPKLVHREGWNRLIIRVEDDRHILSLNGKQVADVRDHSSAHGKIGIQVHAGDQFHGMQITIKQMTLRPL